MASALAELERRRREVNERIIQLKRELEQLDAAIRNLTVAELLTSRKVPATKKNAKQLRIWGFIRELLREQHRRKKGTGLRARQIYDLLVKDHEDIKYSTLRSHLHRLMNEGWIYSTGHSGEWRLMEFKENKEEERIE